MADHLIALSPSALPVVQTNLVDWCQQKIVALGRELREARQNLSIAKLSGWRQSQWVHLIARTRDRMIYFTKIKTAVQAGYLIIPNFPIEVMAVRVDRDAPPAKSVEGQSYEGVPLEISQAKPQLLPPGQGRYVDDKQRYEHTPYKVTKDGKESDKHAYAAVDYDDPDFPVVLVKPMILDATRRAMALRLFDRIGVVTGRKQDPLVVGEIIDPRAKLTWRQQDQRRVTFFIAWWLNPEDL